MPILSRQSAVSSGNSRGIVYILSHIIWQGWIRNELYRRSLIDGIKVLRLKKCRIDCAIDWFDRLISSLCRYSKSIARPATLSSTIGLSINTPRQPHLVSLPSSFWVEHRNPRPRSDCGHPYNLTTTASARVRSLRTMSEECTRGWWVVT